MRAFAAALALAAVLAASASATSQKTVQLKVGDAVDVRQTGVACFAIVSGGKRGIACVLWQNGKPKVGTFGVGLAADGTAIVNKITAGGNSTTVFKRRLSSAAATYRLGVGDVFGLQLANDVVLGCKILNITDTKLAPIYRGTKVSCWRSKNVQPLPHTYGVSISDKFAGVFAFDNKGDVLSEGFLRKQP